MKKFLVIFLILITLTFILSIIQNRRGKDLIDLIILDRRGVKIESLYENNDNIPWEEAVSILNSGEVKQVFQSHSLNVELTLKSGKILNTIEPNIDDIFDEVDKCAKNCRNIILATE